MYIVKKSDKTIIEKALDDLKVLTVRRAGGEDPEPTVEAKELIEGLRVLVSESDCIQKHLLGAQVQVLSVNNPDIIQAVCLLFLMSGLEAGYRIGSSPSAESLEALYGGPEKAN